jgi:putative tricarboxylic transport membrane protein
MADRVIFVCTLILAGAYFYGTERLPSLEIGDPLGPKAFPRLLAGFLLLTAAILLLEMLRARKPKPRAGAPEPANESAPVLIGGVALWTLLYFFMYERLGYIVGTVAYLVVLMSYFNRGKHAANVITAVVFPIVSYFMFTKLLGVNLPPGILPF